MNAKNTYRNYKGLGSGIVRILSLSFAIFFVCSIVLPDPIFDLAYETVELEESEKGEEEKEEREEKEVDDYVHYLDADRTVLSSMSRTWVDARIVADPAFFEIPTPPPERI